MFRQPKSVMHSCHLLLDCMPIRFISFQRVASIPVLISCAFNLGIGFKSVFLISSQPHIFSNGYQIKFNEKPCAECNIGYIVPEWVESGPTLSDIKAIYGCSKILPTTTIILPLKSEKVDAVKKQLFFIENAGELRFIILRKKGGRDPSYNTHHTTPK